MDAGRCVNHAPPAELLADPGSLLSQLLAETDDDTQRALRNTAAAAAAAGKEV